MITRISHRHFTALAQRQATALHSSILRASLPARRLLATTAPRRQQPPKTYFDDGSQPKPYFTEESKPKTYFTSESTTEPPVKTYFSDTTPSPQAPVQTYFTDSSPVPPTAPPQLDPAAEPKPKKKRRLLPRILFAAFFTTLGAAVGWAALNIVIPAPPAEPDSPRDISNKERIARRAASLSVVQKLNEDPAWAESWDAYESLSEEHRKQHIMAGTLRGSYGVGGYQRVWYNRATGELVSVVYFGLGTTGWPYVVHGGCLATLLDESCGRAAFKKWGGYGGVTAKLELNYRRPVLANNFYVVRVRPLQEDELPEQERGKGHYKCFVKALIEDPETGHVYVEADALFVGGRGKNGEGNGNGGLKWGEGERAEHERF